MRNYMTISDEERNSILQNHSSFYNGYATGNVPSNLQPLTVDNSIKDDGGITVDNQGNVKTYRNHNVNESTLSEQEDLGPEDRDEFDGRNSEVVGVDSNIEDQRKEANEMEADDMDLSNVDSAYDYDSGGPEQFDGSYSDDSYGLDIDSIMKMFGGDMSPAEYHDEESMMDTHMDGKEKFNDEDSAYEFDSQGGNANVYGEQATNMSIGFVEETDSETIDEEMCEGCGETDESLVTVAKMDKPIGKIFSLSKEMGEECETCEQCGSEMAEGECVECGSMYEEVDEDLHESFDKDRKMIREMFNRFNKFN